MLFFVTFFRLVLSSLPPPLIYIHPSTSLAVQSQMQWLTTQLTSWHHWPGALGTFGLRKTTTGNISHLIPDCWSNYKKSILLFWIGYLDMWNDFFNQKFFGCKLPPPVEITQATTVEISSHSNSLCEDVREKANGTEAELEMDELRGDTNFPSTSNNPPVELETCL